MSTFDLKDVTKYIDENIDVFHDRRLQSLNNLKLNKILKRKNPYLFKAKNMLTAQDIVKGILDAHLSSQEEAIFGEFLECLAIFISSKVYGGQKSSAEGIDLEFSNDGIKYIVSIKSGPHWGNSTSIPRMKTNFKKAKKILGTNTSKTKIRAVNGCCYGKYGQPDQGDYLKLCGQRFWEFISGNENLYTEIIEPLGIRAKAKNDAFEEAYVQRINEFTLEFAQEFCDKGKIIWERIVKLNSGYKD